MKCFNHPTEEAQGICKHCSRALCKTCLVPNEYDFVVCSERCSQEATLAQKMMDKSKQAFGIAPGRLPALIIFLALLGLLFTVIGLLTWIGGNLTAALIPLGGGILMFIAAGLNYYNQKNSGLVA